MEYSKADPYRQTSQIRSTGYELTAPLTTTIPPAVEPSSIFSSFFSIISDSSDKKALFNLHADKKVEILDEKTLLVSQSNKLVIYHYKVVDDRMQMTVKCCFLLREQIAKICCSSAMWFERVERCNFFVVQFANKCSFALYKIEHNFNVTELAVNKLDNRILKVKFVSICQFTVVTQNAVVFSYFIKGKRLQQSAKYKVTLDETMEVKSAQICVFVHQVQKFYVFLGLYSAYSKRSFINLYEFSKQKKVIQLVSRFENLFQRAISQRMHEKLQIYSFQQKFLVKSDKTLLVLQKRFSKYVCSDAISDISEVLCLLVIDLETHFILCTISANQVELWQLQRKELGFKCKLMDLIQTDGSSLAANLLKVWIFKSNKIELAFLANGSDPRQIDIYLTQKGDKLTKLVERVKKDQRMRESFSKQEFNARVRKIEDLGARLGFKKREFYLRLWHNSEKNSAQIFQYLLPCLDFNAIFQQLQVYLRMKSLKVIEMIKVLKSIEGSLLEQVAKRLELPLVQHYLSCNFQRRKLKLYSGQVVLNFEKYSKIAEMNVIQLIQYSIDLQLFPEKFYHDIRWKEQDTQVPLEITKILREFRLIILQDFTGFLLELLEPYKLCLKQIIAHFYYLLPQYPLKISIIREHLFRLSNIYPEEKLEESQHFWLGYITEMEWEEEESSLHFLHGHMHPYFHTSLINDRLKEFRESKLYRKERNKQYVLLQSSRAQFEARLPALDDATPLITLLESENRVALQLNQASQNEHILQIMKDKNNLPLQQYYKFLRLSKLHLLLINQRVIDASTTILELMQIPDFKLVRFFFLGERPRIDLLFQKVASFYTGQAQFNQVIKGYVESEQCSTVELQMLVKHIGGLEQREIAESQQILDIIIEGYMKRIEARESNKSAIFMRLMKEIPLGEELITKLSIFQSVKTSCYSILRDMKMAKLSYHTIISELDTVVQTLVNTYFQEFAGKEASVYIEQREISLLYPRNLFAIVLYLKDKVYSYRSQVQTYLSFGFALAAWNQFALIQECFGSGLVIDDQDVSPDEFYYLLITNLITKYEQNCHLLYDAQTIHHVRSLVSLLSDHSPLKVIERAKIQVSGILQALGYSVSFQYMRLIQQQWSAGENERMALFKDIINQFWETTNFQTFRQLYNLLETTRLGCCQTTEKNSEFVRLSKFLCKKLIIKQKYGEICQIIYYLNSNEKQARAGEVLMSQCLLQMISARDFKRIEEVQQSKAFIDYYLANQGNLEATNKLFLSKFQSIQPHQHDFRIHIHDDILKLRDGQKSEITTQELWAFINAHFKVTFRAQSDQSRVTTKSRATTKSKITSKSKIAAEQQSVAAEQQSAAADKELVAAEQQLVISEKGLAVPEKQLVRGQRLATAKQALYMYFFLYRVISKPAFLLELNRISFNHDKTAILLECMVKDSRFAGCLSFQKICLDYLRGLYKLHYLATLNQQSKKEESGQAEAGKQQADFTKILQFDKIEQEKLLIMVAEVARTPENAHLYAPLKRLARIIANQSKKWHSDVLNEVVAMGLRALQNIAAAINSQHQLKESVNLYNAPVAQTKRTFKFAQFQKRRQKFQLHRNVTSQKVIIEQVLQDLNDNSFESFDDISSEFKLPIKKLYTVQRDSKDSKELIELGDVLSDLKIEDDEKQSESIINDLKSLCTVHCDEQILEDVSTLIHEKQYEQLRQKYETKLILRVISEQFFSNIDLKPTPKTNGYVAGSRRRLLRSNTIKTFDESQSKVLLLLELLQNLKIGQTLKMGQSPKQNRRMGQSCVKLKLLRQTLVLLSSDSLLQLEGYILMLFNLKILLDPSKNPKLVLNHMVQNVSEHDGLHFESFEELVKLATFFLGKCREEGRRLGPSACFGPEDHGETAKLYRVYLAKLFQSEKPAFAKMEELRKVIQILGSQQLSSINQSLLAELQGQHQLLEGYLLAIYQTQLHS